MPLRPSVKLNEFLYGQCRSFLDHYVSVSGLSWHYSTSLRAFKSFCGPIYSKYRRCTLKSGCKSKVVGNAKSPFRAARILAISWYLPVCFLPCSFLRIKSEEHTSELQSR